MTPIVSFIKCLAVMAHSLSGGEVAAWRSEFSRWVADSEPFVRKFGILRDFKTVTDKFLRSRLEMDEAQGADASARFKAAVASMVRDNTITQEQLAMIKDCTLYFRKDSVPAHTRITKNILTVTGDSKLATAFLPAEDVESTNEVGNPAIPGEMAKIVLKLTGRKNDPILTLNEIRDFRASHEKDILRYSELRKVFVTNYKRSLFKFVRSSGKLTLDVKVVAKYLTSLGCNYIPKGFVGKIDEQGKLYTVAGRQIAGFLVGEVVMNPSYDPAKDNTYVCTLKGSNSQRLRTVDFNTSNKTARFDKVGEFMKDVDKYRKKWLSDLSSLDSHTQVCATIVEAIYITQARIGGDSKNQEGEDRYGMSTLLLKQLKALPNGFEFNYVGKKGTHQHHVIIGTTPSNKRVIANIKNFIKGKKPTDLVFTDRGRKLTGASVNGYLKSIGVPSGITIHKFRHLAGTKLALSLLAKAPFKKADAPTQTAVEKWLKEEMKIVGEQLHHRIGSGDNQKVTGMTAISAYISPQILKGFFNDLGLRVPKWVPKA